MNRTEKYKVDIFLETGKLECVNHGIHSEWTYRERTECKKRKVNYYRCVECNLCRKNYTKLYNKRHPTHQDDYRFSFNGIIVRSLAQARSRAKKRNLPFELDVDWFKDRLEIQKNKCVYSGLEFDFSRTQSFDENRKFLPSIDQKIAGLGYTKENSEIVCSIVNMMKIDLLFCDFLFICEKITEYNKK